VRNLAWLGITIITIACFTACTTTDTYAPVMDATPIETLPKSGVYRVATHDTLYSIAWRYGLDYQDLAQRNNITSPYHIETGQVIYLAKHAPNKIMPPTSESTQATRTQERTQRAPSSQPIEKEPSANVSQWRRPATGPIIGAYSAQNKGLNFGGHLGDPIYATAAGKVVYSGDGLRGYGNLIIIKHNSTFLTAYAHNRKVFVKEGDWVKAGQEIAEMGNTGTRRVMLHFEIRRSGKPVNPLNYLTNR
jgi:lipoprotein NlpD